MEIKISRQYVGNARERIDAMTPEALEAAMQRIKGTIIEDMEDLIQYGEPFIRTTYNVIEDNIVGTCDDDTEGDAGTE